MFSKKRTFGRRQFLKTMGCSAPFMLTASGIRSYFPAQTGKQAKQNRPNILWITCEDISADLGSYGDKYAHTPVLDELARQGVRYTNAFGVTGVCAPNRSCLITGVYPSSLGSHNMRCTTRLPDFIRCFPEYLRKNGYFCTNNSKTDYNFPTPEAAWDQCSNKAHWRNRKPGQPFFSVFNYTVTHESRCRGAPRDRKKFDPAKVPVPPFHPDAKQVRENWAKYYENISIMNEKAGNLLKNLEQDGLADDTIVFFFSDHGAGMPGCKKWVWHSGIHVPLIIRFPEKFGSHQAGKDGSTCDRMVSFVDFAPTVLSLAGVKVPQYMQGRAFLGEQAGKPRKYVYAHRDRMAERYDTVRVVRDADYQYIRNFMPHLSWSQYVSYKEKMPSMKIWRKLSVKGELSGPEARYFKPEKPQEELYDTTRDPHQINNLAQNPEYKNVLQRMRTACRKWMTNTHDLGLLPEYELHKKAENSTPWRTGRNPEKNPVDDLLAAAEPANEMKTDNIPQLVRLLQADEPAVRWWGALGLVALGDKAGAAENPLIDALKDKSPNVRIAAAEALVNLDNLEQAEPVLKEGLQYPSPFIRLRTVNVLDRHHKIARPMLSRIRQAKMKSKQHRHVASYLGRIAGYLPEQLAGKKI